MGMGVKDLTQGKPSRLIFRFAIPVMIGNAFNQFYVVTDSLIISRILGMQALAALGSADWYTFLFISVVQAVAQGFAIRAGQDFGAGDYDGMKKTLAHSLVLSALAAAALTGLALGSLDLMLELLRTPGDVLPMAKSYLFVFFAGLAALMFLSYTSAMLRALGNARTPLIAMIISTVLNIVLDLWMVPARGMPGAAEATIIAQAAGGLINLFGLKETGLVHLDRKYFAWDPQLDKGLLKLSLPMMIQNLLIGLGGMAVQSAVNTFALAYIAAYSCVNKLFGLIELAALSYGYAVTAYIAQNYGAGEKERIRSGLVSGLWIAVATSVVVSVLIFVFGPTITSWYLTGDTEIRAQAQELAVQFQHLLAWTLSLLYILHVMRSALQGLGNTVMPMISGLAEVVVRVSLALGVVKYWGWTAILWTETLSWIGTDLVLVFALRRDMKKLMGPPGQKQTRQA
jgi:putative MATE family efflux protein